MPTDAPSAPAPSPGSTPRTTLAVLALVAAVPLLWLGVQEFLDHRATCSPPGRPRRTICAATAGTWPTAAASGWPPSGWCSAGSPPAWPC
jgi:hypothetical protein